MRHRKSSKVWKRNVFIDLEAIKNINFIFKRLLQIKKALWNFKYLFPFFLFKDWVLETQLRIEFLTPNIGVWNQQHKTLHVSLFLCLSCISVWRYCRKSRVKSAFRAQLWHLSLVLIFTAQLHSTKPELRFKFARFAMVRTMVPLGKKA